jgi:hypothetical protein
VATRLTFGSLYDALGFKILFFILMVINTIISIFCYPSRVNTVLFYIMIQMNYFVVAGIFSLFPAPAAKTFGPKYGA